MVLWGSEVYLVTPTGRESLRKRDLHRYGVDVGYTKSLNLEEPGGFSSWSKEYRRGH